MALIQCPECSNAVSNTASTCPHCGAPIAQAAAERVAIGTPVSTIQETSKSLKVHILLSTVLFFVGITVFFVAMNASDGASGIGAIGFLIFLVGAIWFFVTKFRIWWHHK